MKSRRVSAAIGTGVPPPPPQVEAVPPLRPGSVWIHDHWLWANGADVWIAGHWMERRPGWRYVQTRRRPCGPNRCDNAGSPGLLKIGSC